MSIEHTRQQMQVLLYLATDKFFFAVTSTTHAWQGCNNNVSDSMFSHFLRNRIHFSSSAAAIACTLRYIALHYMMVMVMMRTSTTTQHNDFELKCCCCCCRFFSIS